MIGINDYLIPTKDDFNRVECNRKFKIVINDGPDFFVWYGPSMLAVLSMLYGLYPDFNFKVEELPL